RTEIYQNIIDQLLAAGHLYESYVTAEEMAERNRAMGRDEKQGYDNHERELTEEQKAAYREEGRTPALRLKVPDGALDFDDLVRGPISFPAGSTIDFVVVRPNGKPLYTFVNPVDDALMGITHVLRGEDLLSSTPRQIALYHALIDIGVAEAIPHFGHLPYVMGEGNKKLSKRNPESNLFLHRDRGFIREGLLNYLALLGWSIAADRDIFTLDEMCESFDIADVNPNPARFDQKKADAINSAHIRLLEPNDFRERLVPYLQSAGVIGSDQDALGQLGEDSGKIAQLAHDAIADLSEFTTEAIQAALSQALIEKAELKPRVAFGVVRTAISGRRVTPPLFESMEILGRAVTLARLEAFAKAH
ncbi:MAG: glutamate--tRNA ligase, partial [Actinobacteria bacterium]|nr:glutamate--tRNA ligase [Actinomycetota bacterium]